ncbi:MAG: UMP kinase [Candidatus Pacebacteria bacterium]|nr:UMP kinase [Candidatus Paceibacterota bacterium]MCF7862512.1 UMP kinase [Candidatus Paceibacterota bacterium]
MKETIIISLGGSLIVPEEVDVGFLNDFKKIILEQVSEGKNFVISTGGGKICRKYQDSAKALGEVSNNDLDWIGIASLRLNAELLRVVFGEFAHSEVIHNFTEKFSADKPIIITSAYKPGHSTDYGAILVAKTLGAKKVINLSNIDYVYDSDPKTNSDAKKIEEISWKDYMALIPTEWSPGLSSPFDPVASKMAEENNIEVVIMNGKPIENLENYFKGNSFVGTTIK